MNNKTITVKPLTKEETKALLSLIERSKIINNKTTNATTNKLKIEEWKRISEEFNAAITSCRRTPQQLRLKWENLKKVSRKRNNAIRMNNIKTGGGGPEYIPPDDIFDRVATLLGSKANGFTVQYAGDAKCTVYSGVGDDNRNENLGLELLSTKLTNEVEVQEAEVLGNVLCDTVTPKPKQHSLDTPRASGFKRKLITSDDNRATRDIAIAEYFIAKRKVLEAKLEKMMLDNEKRRLEIENLKNQK